MVKTKSALTLPQTTAYQQGLELPVMEAFYTLQGEGHHAGKAAYFIRLAGCDVGCVWCDVKESWSIEDHPVRRVGELVFEAAQHPGRMAVITGGEPLMHPLDELTRQLRQAGFATHIETSGAHALSGQWDWICLSPKKFKQPLPESYRRADELKVVIYNRKDFEWAEAEASKVGPGCRLLLQPEWSKAREVTPLLVAYIQAHPQWNASLQTHKYLDIP